MSDSAQAALSIMTIGTSRLSVLCLSRPCAQFHDAIRARLFHTRIACNSGHIPALPINLDDEPIVRNLLLDLDDLLALDNEVPSRIKWALLQLRELGLSLISEHAIAALKHDGYPSNPHITLQNDILARR